MDNRIRDLLHRNLQEVFGEGDATRRRVAIAELYTEDCVLYAPPGMFVGRAALDKFAGELRANGPIGILDLVAERNRQLIVNGLPRILQDDVV